ncbi:MAG: hypothetical protein U9Q63_02465, partial [Patescibacteria group bacterium]|nr:hypothetical protein [Patescibacteria group bacterium]
AGRLDPMAEGSMILLENQEVHQRDKYLALDKEYLLTILLGVSTDTYDTLGLITNQNLNLNISPDSIKKIIRKYPRTYLQPYPPYSSKTVNGKPLWYWAKNNQIDQIKIPTKKVQIKNIKLIKISEQKISILVKKIINNIKKVKGDFRQKIIIENWESLVKNHPNQKLTVISLVISCSTGTYMRSIANNFGRKLQIPTLALKIKRNKIGNYKTKN